MDIRAQGYNGQLLASGIADAKTYRGSVMEILSAAIRDLNEMTPRRNDYDGHKEIVIRIGTKPYGARKEEVTLLRVDEVMSGIDPTLIEREE